MEVVLFPALISHTSSPRKQYLVVLGAVPISSNYLLQLLQSAVAFYLIKQPSAFCRDLGSPNNRKKHYWHHFQTENPWLDTS